MKLRSVVASIFFITILVGCGKIIGTPSELPSPIALPADNTVICQDAQRFADQAELDQKAGLNGNYVISDPVSARADFMSSLSIIARIKCTGVSSEPAEDQLKLAFDRAHKAQNAKEVQGVATHWSQADYFAQQAIVLLLKQKIVPVA